MLQEEDQVTGNDMLSLLLFSLLDAANVSSARCDVGAPIFIARKSELPVAVISALPHSMSDQGQPYQSDDIVADPPLPVYRFVTAIKQGCDLWVTYEHGGRGHISVIVEFVRGDTGWRETIPDDQLTNGVPSEVLSVTGPAKSMDKALFLAKACGKKNGASVPSLSKGKLTMMGPQSEMSTLSCIRGCVRTVA